MPSDTSLLRSFAVITSHLSLSATQSPKEHILSVPRALAKAQARGESSRPAMSSTKQAFLSLPLMGMPTAADVGLTCLNDVAAGIPSACLSSRTSCQELKASRKFIYPGLPLSISMGRSVPSAMYIFAGFWFGLQPYLSSNSFMLRLPSVQPFLFMRRFSSAPVLRSM